MLLGGIVALLAGLGILRLPTTYARFHAAGKASPVSFLIAAVGAGFQLGLASSGYLVLSAIAMTLTLPVGVHFLFRAVSATSSSDHLVVDDLASDQT